MTRNTMIEATIITDATRKIAFIAVPEHLKLLHDLCSHYAKNWVGAQAASDRLSRLDGIVMFDDMPIMVCTQAQWGQLLLLEGANGYEVHHISHVRPTGPPIQNLGYGPLIGDEPEFGMRATGLGRVR